MYIFDASVLIRANNEYYPMDRFWQVWEWLEKQAIDGNLKIPFEIFQELLNYNDNLSEWSTKRRGSLVIDEDVVNLERTISDGYGFTAMPTEEQLDKMGRDPFLLSYCLNDFPNRIAVSHESSKPSRMNANMKIPDACGKLGIPHRTLSMVLKELGFFEK